MFPRVPLLVGVLALLGTGCRNNDGAVKLTVSYEGFKPGCIRVAVKDARGEGEARTTELVGKGEATGGAVTVAAFREASWSNTLTLTAEAFEKACTGKGVVTSTETVTVDKGAVVNLELKLAADDKDQDGYVSEATGGSDCDDDSIEVNPSAQELCNNRDDNCDRKRDEGFEVGARCDAAGGCKGAWTCNTEGARTCEQRPDMWRPDEDKDGQGSKEGPGLSACNPPEGYVGNSDDCDDTNAQRYVGATELCNEVDDNCDGTADDGLRVGESCTGEGDCTGKRVCAPDGSVACDSPKPTTLYADNDQDSHGAPDAAVTNCGPTRPGYVAIADDCDDTLANVYTGATELCDALDNNCDGTKDEGLGLGESCGEELGCTGAKACAADGSVQCAYTTPPSTYYPDEDLDSHGKTDAGVLTCTPNTGYILQAGDCNDGNPFTHADARELCDQEDNNCDGTEDEGDVCPTGGGSWASYSTGNGDDWRSVAVWGNGGVWVTGGTNLLQVRKPGETTFVTPEGKCSGVWNAVWVDPRDGKALLGGDDAMLGSHLPGATSCDYNGAHATDTDVRGIIGVPVPGGDFDIHIIGKDKLYPYNGRAFRFVDFSTPLEAKAVEDQLWDAHGISREVLFAVGGQNRPEIDARIFRFNPSQNTWVDENVQSISGIADKRLLGVWVVNSQLAYAVGEGSSMLMWNGTSWNPHPAPASESLRSVLAFGKNSIYVTTSSGKLYRYNGSTWNEASGVSTGQPLNDLAGTSPEDIWVVGDKGKRFHWPQ
ncbi:hypothetical protein JQX13_07445 [Archangium violaceum]|uniref:MopE-related protein n=1 Tax=Archangium violaceum TaxID=83451 RepID=UPI00193B50D0|nr:MopE-related protein [Archangium violaceum]QRK09928.1 hypothetical protein JQX13_07445 [Archangium violaceum]